MDSIFAFPAKRWLFTAANVKSNTWYSDILRKQSCASFALAEPLMKSHPYGLDAVAVCIRDELSGRDKEGGLSVQHAAAITRGWFDRWVEGIAHAEHDGQQNIVFVITETADPAAVKANRNWSCGLGPHDQLDQHVKGLPWPVRRVICVHLYEVVAGIRQRCAKAGLDLSGYNFAPPPDHPFLIWIKEDWAEWRARNNVTGPSAKFPKPNREQRERIASITEFLQ